MLTADERRPQTVERVTLKPAITALMVLPLLQYINVSGTIIILLRHVDGSRVVCCYTIEHIKQRTLTLSITGFLDLVHHPAF
jgi:hypothetical protein